MQSEKIDLLASALVKAQAEMKPAPMNAVNPFLHNKYADLGTLIQTAEPVLAKNGLAISQLPTNEGGQLGVRTILMHQSGQFIESTVSLPLGDEKGKSLAQVAGSVITYLRRYSYSAILGMYSDEDTDGNDNHKQERPKPENIVVPDKTTPNDYWKLVRITLKWDEAKSKALLERCGGDFEMAFVEAKKEAEAK
jgi:hypothetical protein